MLQLPSGFVAAALRLNYGELSIVALDGTVRSGSRHRRPRWPQKVAM
jgi:hypothetical protein